MNTVKLNKFSEFANSLLPHEISYLMGIQQFKDPLNLEILKQIEYNCNHFDKQIPFDEHIDKRKYSNLKKWITENLQTIDVDYNLDLLLQFDKKIMTDDIYASDEKELIRMIKHYNYPGFYFIRFYEIVQSFGYYLLIRLRNQNYQIVSAFLEKHKANYDRSRETNQTLHHATTDIINHYATNITESKHWEEWLINIFRDNTLDGLNRYLAIVRLTFVYYNYKEINKIAEIYTQLSQSFSEGLFYSKRILSNYYSNRLLFHTQLNELEQAERYGYLSIRYKSSDYLQYVNNLAAILLRRNKNKEALNLVKSAFPEMKKTNSFHNKTGFVSFYLACLNKNGMPEAAENYADSYIKLYKEQVFSQRWHLFFTSFLQSLILQNKFLKVLKIAKHYKIKEKEEEYKQRPVYLPALTWYYYLALYMEGEISDKNFTHKIIDTAKILWNNPQKKRLLVELFTEISNFAPQLFADIRKQLKSTEE